LTAKEACGSQAFNKGSPRGFTLHV